VDGGAVTTTRYLVDSNNHTGFAQVFEERDAYNQLLMSYTLGHDVISQTPGNSTAYPVDITAELLADGHGSTRILWNIDGIPFQYYAYDAFGNMLAGPGLTTADDASTSLLYSGEQTDKTGLQYLRARYYDPRSGRFNRLDPFAGNTSDPQSLHKYLYAHGEPVNGIDPSGMIFGWQDDQAATLSLSQLQDGLEMAQLAKAAYDGSIASAPPGWRLAVSRRLNPATNRRIKTGQLE
jgi:RHS repeat-associated protein